MGKTFENLNHIMPIVEDLRNGVYKSRKKLLKYFKIKIKGLLD
jgi:hypothetical protein